ncbi:MAG: hypothetical protein DMG21_18680 [Acidobacteria bacterium]|nr:MAG: hypothetical protein DMG21_18680 [Acidobacteriota bacterium]
MARARVRNNLHKLTLPFSERSAGFIWFFSFLVKFAQVRKTGNNLVLLLDEPGLTLHGKAQADLLRYIQEKLAPSHQVAFTTHSPFMVPPDDLPSVRIVEDKLIQTKPGQFRSEGTKVRDDTMVTDRDTLFPLQGALCYDITQTLFVGKHTLLVEGPGDILYLEAWSSALLRRGKRGLDRRWTLCPAGGIDRIQPFVALFGGQKLDIAAAHPHAEEAQARGLEFLRATLGIFEIRIAAINENVFGTQGGLEVVEHGIHGLSRRNHHPDSARSLERLREILEGIGDDDFLPVNRFRHLSTFVGVHIKPGHGEPLAFGVQRQVPPHHSESNDAQVLSIHRPLRPPCWPRALSLWKGLKRGN